MKTLIAVMMLLLLAGCSKVEVKVVEVVPYKKEGWMETYHHCVVEEISTRERHKIAGRWGNTGDVFFVSTWKFVE